MNGLMMFSAMFGGGSFGSMGESGQSGQGNQKKSDPLGALYFLCNIHATCFTVWIRSGYGSEALGFAGIIALVVMAFCMALEPLMLFWIIAWILAVIVQRIITFRSKNVVHSRYNAYPWLAMKVPFLKNEKTARQFTEPAMCLLVGVLLLPLSQFMGVFLGLGFITLMVRNAVEQQIHDRRITRMRDARIEGQWYGDQMK